MLAELGRLAVLTICPRQGRVGRGLPGSSLQVDNSMIGGWSPGVKQKQNDVPKCALRRFHSQRLAEAHRIPTGVYGCNRVASGTLSRSPYGVSTP